MAQKVREAIAHSLNLDAIVERRSLVVFDNGNIKVIEDRVSATRTYDVPAVGGVAGSRVMFLSDLNGTAGNDVMSAFCSSAT